MAIGNSYDFNHPIRDVSELFDTLIVNPTSILARFPIFGSQNITATKYEWLNDTLSPTQSTIASFDTDGDGTGINLASTAGIEVGSILRFSTSADVSRTEYVKVASVDSATDLTVVRDYAGSTGETFIVGDKVFLISSPKSEGSNAGNGSIHQATSLFNYTEIFDAIAEVTKTSEVINTYDKYNTIANQSKVVLTALARKLENALIYGLPLIRSAGVPGTMGGIRHYISQAGGNTTSAGAAISSTIINNSLEQILSKGSESRNFALLCNVNQGRKITALNTSGQNPVVNEIDPKARTMGNFVTNFIGDIPLQGGLMASVFTSFNLPKDQVMLLDMDRISLKTLRGMQEMDATLPGSDYIKRRYITELTLEVKNPTEAHAIITGLTV